MGIREQALEAKAIADQDAAVAEAKLAAWRVVELYRLLNVMFGDSIVIHDGGVMMDRGRKIPMALVDNLRFGLLYDSVLSFREQLVVIFACEGCGDLGEPHPFGNLAALGTLLEKEEHYLCVPCRIAREDGGRSCV